MKSRVWVSVVVGVLGLGACAARVPASARVPVADAVDVAGSVGAVWADGCRLMAANAVGFVVGPNLVATVAHAVQGQTTITFDGRVAIVVAVEPRSDTAILRVETLKPPLSFEMAREDTRVRVVLVGSELDVRVKSIVAITHTNIPAHTSYVRAGIILDKPVKFGDSGAPVVNDSGLVVGMVYATAADDDQSSYAVAASEVQTLLTTVKVGALRGSGICP